MSTRNTGLVRAKQTGMLGTRVQNVDFVVLPNDQTINSLLVEMELFSKCHGQYLRLVKARVLLPNNYKLFKDGGEDNFKNLARLFIRSNETSVLEGHLFQKKMVKKLQQTDQASNETEAMLIRNLAKILSRSRAFKNADPAGPSTNVGEDRDESDESEDTEESAVGGEIESSPAENDGSLREHVALLRDAQQRLNAAHDEVNAQIEAVIRILGED